MIDYLQKLIDKQIKFDKTVQDDERFRDLDKREKINALLNFMVSEVYEVKEDLGFLWNDQDKWWKNRHYSDNTDYEHVREEMIDVLHVWLSIAHRIGFDTSEKIMKKYIEKNKINFNRQELKY